MSTKNKSIIIAIGAIIVLLIIIVLAKKGSTQLPADQTSTNTTTTSMDSNTQDAGLKITTIKEGTGAPAKNGDSVSVQYTGTLTDGTVFDSNVDPKFGHPEPFSFTLGAHMVIAGWDQGVLGMKVGEKRHLVIPSDLAYGAQGAGGLIPPNATLEFDVEVTSIN
jgi:FKBP-type peptidyl-prolyl cis-trans isomerase